MFNESDRKAALFAAGFAEVEALNRAGRWQDALAAGAWLYENFRTEPRACLCLAETLAALHRPDQAEAVLRDAHQRFPGEPALSTRLARLAAARQDWPQALLHWREAGMPHSTDPADLRDFALVLAHAGEPAAALRLVTPSAAAPLLRLAQAELHLHQGNPAEAAALWPALSTEFTLSDPGFAALCGQLAREADAETAQTILRLLLAEPDPGTEDWTPAIAETLRRLPPADPLHQRIRDAVKQPPGDGLAATVAQRLAGIPFNSDALSTLLARAVADGRTALLPLLFETPSAQSIPPLRIALRLYLNRALATEDAIATLPPRSAAALLQVARVADPDALGYIAGLARTRYPAPTRRDLPYPEDVVGQIAHAEASSATSLPPPPAKLRVAICVSGRLPGAQDGCDLIDALGLQSHDCTVFAHVWQTTGTPAAAPTLCVITDRLPKHLAASFTAAAEAAGLAGLRRLYPNLTQTRPSQDRIDLPHAQALFRSDHVTVEDDRRPELAARAPAWKALHAARGAFGLALATKIGFDLCLRLPAETAFTLRGTADWHDVAQQAQAERRVFAERPYGFDRALGFTAGLGIAAGTMETMAILADAASLGEQVATAKLRIHGLPAARAMEQCQAMQLHLRAIPMAPADFLRPSATPPEHALQPSAALALLWQDINARRPAAPDNALVRAAMADVTGGLGL